MIAKFAIANAPAEPQNVSHKTACASLSIHGRTDLTVVEQCATPAPEPVLAPPAADLEASDDQVVLVVRQKAATASAHPLCHSRF
jgi:hypothetical protein